MSSRDDADVLLASRVHGLRLVDSSRAKALGRMGINTVRDLLTNYPHRYVDLGNTVTAQAATVGQTVTVVGTIDEVKQRSPRPNMNIVEAALFDGTGVIMGVWFRQPWMARKLHKGDRVAFSGKVTFDYGFKRITSPYLEVLDTDAGGLKANMVPIHPATEGLSTAWMRRLVATALEKTADLHDPLPASLRRRYGYMGRMAALRAIHFPHDDAQREQARERLAYEEVLCLQLEMMMRRDAETRGGECVAHEPPGPLCDAFRTALPFMLTVEQEAALSQISDDMVAHRCMNRMLLGDVGTGKTVVAGLAMVQAAESGHQSVMMAPTEVLARQYGEKLGPYLDAIGLRWATLTGSTPSEERAGLLAALEEGTLQVLFGTHALIEPDVRFHDLSLVIIDEQHRFGVDQRSALRLKGPGSDLLVMTATPIPRTLALTLYGDLECSYIRKRPSSRPATTTTVISRHERGRGYDAIREAVQEGRQAYIVCPLVGLNREQRHTYSESGALQLSLAGETDISDPKAAETEAAFLADKVFPGHHVGLLTGRMSSTDKRRVMSDFRSGKIDILVTTTVIEVGIDVPNATVMMIEDAERFGLSQLHQLRGRVGRGEHPGQVFLVADPGKDDTETNARMKAMVECDDGFELAEQDLRSRREGDVLGSRQHGASLLKLVSVIEDEELIRQAHADARTLLETDPLLEGEGHRRLAGEVALVFADHDDDGSKGA